MKNKQDIQIKIRVSSIHIVNLSIEENDKAELLNDATFKTQFSIKIFDETKEIGLRSKVKISDIEDDFKIGSITLEVRFAIQPFEKIFSIENSGRFKIPQNVLEFLTNEHAGILRGIIFEKFKDTTIRNVAYPLTTSNKFLQPL